MRRDHRPYRLKKMYLQMQRLYVEHFLRPQFECLGKGTTFIKPWHVEVFGAPIRLGHYANVIATSDRKIRLAVWTNRAHCRGITVGSYSLICPGVRISAGLEVHIGDNCMLAGNVYISDSDWHDIYCRTELGKARPVRIQENVWIGDSAIIGKGVTIGTNSIVGAGAVVVSDIPTNTVAAGNPAKVVKHLDPHKPISTRAQWFADPYQLSKTIDHLDQTMLRGNTVWHWLRTVVFPTKRD